ncbi:MAG: glycerol-3-phosphate acyltransferase [Bacteroidota bacterium]
MLAGLFGYLLGSIPTAFLLVRWKSAIDIRSAGSGNVGTLNSFEVTRSKTIGALVLVGDLLKGVLAVLVARWVWGLGFEHWAVAGTGALLGHNFPVWLGFRGGRGLATGAGVFGVVAWPVVVMWVFLWLVGYGVVRRVNPANAIATIIMLAVVLLTPAETLTQTISGGIPAGQFRWFSSILMTLILMKHIAPIREYIEERRNLKSPA